MIVLTYANRRNQFLDEWESSVKEHGFNYKIIGMNEKWENWKTRTNAITKELQKLQNKNEIVVICDAFDLLFINGDPDKLEKKYKEIGKILLGSDPYCIPHNCILNICNGNANLNAGFIIGKVSQLLEAYEFIENYNDDQFGWNMYAKSNCDKIFIDKDSEIVIDYYIDFHKILLNNNNIGNNNIGNVIKFENLSTGKITEPFAIHLPAQYFNSQRRSEFIRNYLFPYRTKIEAFTYFENFLKSYNLNIISFNVIVIITVIFIIFGITLYIKRK